jgi:hypothetical protein
MRYFPTDEFSKKLTELNTNSIRSVSMVIHYIEMSDKATIYNNSSKYPMSSLGKDIYTIKFDKIHIYFTTGCDKEGDYLLLLDITIEHKILNLEIKNPQRFFAINDPKKNPNLNPKSNYSINPKFNYSLNPKSNYSINPKSNYSINPKSNYSINPKSNYSINPKSNYSINPKSNYSINPKSNYSINPLSNMSFGGPFIYSINLDQQGYIIRANETVDLIFSMSAEFIGIGVKLDSGFVNLFDVDNEWIGYLVPTKTDVKLKFSIDGDWNGLVV